MTAWSIPGIVGFHIPDSRKAIFTMILHPMYRQCVGRPLVVIPVAHVTLDIVRTAAPFCRILWLTKSKGVTVFPTWTPPKSGLPKVDG